MKKYKTVDIHCPVCGRYVGAYDERSTTNFISRCSKCNKRVIYHIDTRETEVKDIPKRNCSSGVTFI